MPKGVSNGSIVQGPQRAQIIHYLAQGFSVYYVARRFKRDYQTIAAVRDAEFTEILKRKPILAAQAERGALEAGEKIVEAVRNGDIKGAALIPAYGVFVDKALLLRGDNPLLTVHHQHTHTHQHELVNALRDATGKIEKRVVSARVVESETVPSTHLIADKAPAQKPGKRK